MYTLPRVHTLRINTKYPYRETRESVKAHPDRLRLKKTNIPRKIHQLRI